MERMDLDGAKEVFGISYKISLSDLISDMQPGQIAAETLQAIDRETLLVELSKFAAVLHNENPDGVSAFLNDALRPDATGMLEDRYALSGSLLAKLRSGLQANVANPLGVCAAQAMVLMHAKDGGDVPTRGDILHLLLLANDVTSKWHDSDPTDALLDDEAFLAEFSRAQLFGQNHDAVHEYNRSTRLFAETPSSQDQARWADWQRRALGRDCDQYMLGLAAPLYLASRGWGCVNADGRRRMPLLPPDFPWPATDPGDAGWQASEIGRASVTIGELARAVSKASDGSGVPTGVAPLLHSPILSLSDGRVLFLSPHIGRELLRGGLWNKHRLAARDDKGKPDSLYFLRVFGLVFEQWCRRVASFVSQADGYSVIMSKVIGQGEIIDIIIKCETDAEPLFLLVSVKSGVMQERILKGAASAREIVQWFDHALFRQRRAGSAGAKDTPGAVRDLHDIVTAVRAGVHELVIPRSARLHSLIVTYEETSGDHWAMRRWMRKRCAEEGLVFPPDATMPRMLPVADFERLVGYVVNGGDLPSILERLSDEASDHLSIQRDLYAQRVSNGDLQIPEFLRRFEEDMARVAALMQAAIPGTEG